jgi:hypothetical protein
MEVPFSPDEQARISQIASSADLTKIREMLHARYEEMKSGRVKPIDGEEAFARLRRKSEERRAARS